MRSCTLLLALMLAAVGVVPAQSRIKVLLVTGQSNRFHNWEVSSPIVKRQLEDSGRFAVTVATTPPKGAAPNQDMSSFAPTFSDYQVVVLDYEGFEFAPPVKQAFVDYMKNGGGLVVLHAADNAFPGWAEYNEMIGVGGWGGFTPGYASRTQAAGPKIRWRDGGLVLDNDTPGNAQHPSPHDYLMTVRAPEHPIMKGLPPAWMHPKDELYSNLRGPARNVTVLATATAPTSMPNGTGENEPLVMAIAYGKGRVFHDTLGHVGATQKEPIVPMNSVDYIVLLQRGTEWAATGAVTIPVPRDFPTAAGSQNKAPVVEPGFTSLFNGTDFTGWKISGPAESFTIQDGAIVANGATSHAYYDGPFRNHSFRDFELRVDAMTRAGSNGGIYVLTELQDPSAGLVRATGRFPSKGFEIQVNNSHTDRVRTGSLYHVADVFDDSPAKDDEWFTESIVVKGNTITISVNGKQTVTWTQPADWNGGREGPGRSITGPGTIALQGHDPKSTVYYKNIRIKPLD